MKKGMFIFVLSAVCLIFTPFGAGAQQGDAMPWLMLLLADSPHSGQLVFTSVPDDVTVQPGDSTDPSVTGEPTATTDVACNPVTIEYDDSSDPGLCSNIEIITRTWTARDQCANTIRYIQTITVQGSSPIVWQGPFTQFRYVAAQGGALYAAPDAWNTNAYDVAGSTEEQGNYSDVATSTLSESPLNGVFEMWGGAQGTGSAESPDYGLRVKAYTEIHLDPEHFDPTVHGVDVEQGILSLVSRRFSVSEPGVYHLKAILDGVVDFNVFGNPGSSYHSSYFVDGVVAIDALTAYQGQVTGILPWDMPVIPLNDGTRSDQKEVILLPETPDHEQIVYQLKAILTIDTELKNLILGVGVSNPSGAPSFEGPFLIGSETNPLDFRALLCYESGLPEVPQFVYRPADTLRECGSITSPSVTGQPVVVSSCSDLTLTKSDTLEQVCGMAGKIKRTWTATACGHMVSYVQTITVVDTTPPQFISTPSDLTVECGQSTHPNATGWVQATDSCGIASVSYSDSESPGCGNTKTITRTWWATDMCDNIAGPYVQTITVEDTTPPQFISTPSDLTVECGADTDPSATGLAQATDNCGSVDVTYNDSETAGGCGNTKIITRTWTATDQCGQSATPYVQTITVEDTTPPQFTYTPPNVLVPCTDPINIDPSVTGQAEASDDCGTTSVTYTDSTQNPKCGDTFNRGWYAQDECQNEATPYVQTITIEPQGD